jgi:membrane associated rhomboid family serine protease
MLMRIFIQKLCPKLGRVYFTIMVVIILVMLTTMHVFAVDDMWTVANRIIKDVYTKLAGVSTVLAGLMTAVAVVGAKLSNNQHKVDQAWDWLKRIWVAWAIINGIGAFLAYVVPLFNGLATIDVAPPSGS